MWRATSSSAAIVTSGETYRGVESDNGEFSKFKLDLKFGGFSGNVFIAAFSVSYALPIGQLSGRDNQSATGISRPGL